MTCDVLKSCLIELPFNIQFALLSGFLTYVVAYEGLKKWHSTFDKVIIILIFTTIALIPVVFLPEMNMLYFYTLVFLVPFISGVIWRKIGINNWRKVFRLIKVYADDGVFTSWSVILQQERKITQIAVHLKDGSVLILNDRTKLDKVLWKGLYFDNDGSIILAVQTTQLPDGTIIQHEVFDEFWGVQFVYIRESEISQITARLK